MLELIKGGHVSNYEHKRYGRFFSIKQRKYQYAKKILQRVTDMTFKKLNDIVKWKFGAGGISTNWYFKYKSEGSD